MAPRARSPLMYKSTGRVPISHPPGKATTASPNRASNGPITKNPPRIFPMSSGQGSTDPTPSALTHISPLQASISAPNDRRIEAIVRVSERFGTPWSLEVPEQQRVAARIDNAEFLEPLIGTWPESLQPPVMVNLGSRVRVLGGVWNCRWERKWGCLWKETK